MDQQRKIPYYLRILLLVVGFISLALGIVGVLLPVLPTTPFLLLSAACFANSSEKFYNWLLNNKIFGTYIRDYREGKGVCRKHKLAGMVAVWITISISVLAVSSWWLRGFLILVALAVTFHLSRIPTKVEGC
jgi:uncharacterized membrane protein YbaN (DUF454 family)